MMKRDLPHSAFREPDDMSTQAWRYMPLSQLLFVLLTSELPLIRVDRLGDPFEGSITKELKAQDLAHAANISDAIRWGGPNADQLARPIPAERVIEGLRKRRISIIRSSHASCWRMGKESEGMWRLYCGENDGVAIRTTCAKLKASITDEATRLGVITYIDYAAGGMPRKTLLEPVMYKRDGFSDEQEVRLLRYLQADANQVLEDPELKGGPIVRMMKWHLAEVVDEIVVSPYADPWYFETVCGAVEKLASSLNGRVVWSRLRGEPHA